MGVLTDAGVAVGSLRSYCCKVSKLSSRAKNELIILLAAANASYRGIQLENDSGSWILKRRHVDELPWPFPHTAS